MFDEVIIDKSVSLKQPQNFSGKCVIGHGPVGTDDRGPEFLYDTGGLVFDGSGTQYQGTGGSVQNLKIRPTKVDSGDALRITGSDLQHRSGEMVIDRVLIYGNGSGQNRGTCRHGVVIDGSMYKEKGSAGIRRISMNNVRVADCRDDSIQLINAVHCCMTNVQVDTGVGKLPILRIVDGQNIMGHNMIINGATIISGSALNVVLSGWFDYVEIGPNVRNCCITGSVRELKVASGATGMFCGVVNSCYAPSPFKVV